MKFIRNFRLVRLDPISIVEEINTRFLLLVLDLYSPWHLRDNLHNNYTINFVYVTIRKGKN